jgi:hypothetical protein
LLNSRTLLGRYQEGKGRQCFGRDGSQGDEFATAMWALPKDRTLAEAWKWLSGDGYQSLAGLTSGAGTTTEGPHARLVRAAA